MYRLSIFPGIACLFLVMACQPGTTAQSPAKDKPVGGRCEGCEDYKAGMPAKLFPTTTLAGPDEPGERLTISGTIYQKDGRTPADGVILYLYQTDAKGLYSPGEKQTQARSHGHLRGWIKTGADGRYAFNTILPGSYPNSRIPRHIHPFIKEAGLSVYFIDDYLFDNDPFLTPEERAGQPQRGGVGIIQLSKNAAGTWVGKRDIIQGKNIPGY